MLHTTNLYAEIYLKLKIIKYILSIFNFILANETSDNIHTNIFDNCNSVLISPSGKWKVTTINNEKPDYQVKKNLILTLHHLQPMISKHILINQLIH